MKLTFPIVAVLAVSLSSSTRTANARITKEMVDVQLNPAHILARSAQDAILVDHAARSAKRHLNRKRGRCSSKPATHSPNVAVGNKPDEEVESVPESSSSSSTSSSSAPAPTTDSNKNQDSDNDNDNTSPITSGDANNLLGSISAFQGKNSGIGSWFRTNKGSDSTNGRSWCETQYRDDWDCFAPSVGTMIRNFNGDQQAAKKAYCGREVKLTNPNNGNTLTGFICDGFDDKWVLSPGSIDLTVGAFEKLHGSFDNNKNTVIKGVEWEFTGGVVSKGTRKSPESQQGVNY